jgi:disulfide oxidoreductase YuzD
MKRVLFLILTCITLITFSQSIDVDVVASSGGKFNTENVNLSFTIGETMVETYQQADLMLTQGFHQSTFTFTELTNVDNRALEVSLFPNPATDYVNIKCEEHGYMYRFIDMDGKVIFDGYLKNDITKLSLDNVCEAQFLLEVYSTRDKYKKTFKVLKQ